MNFRHGESVLKPDCFSINSHLSGTGAGCGIGLGYPDGVGAPAGPG